MIKRQGARSSRTVGSMLLLSVLVKQRVVDGGDIWHRRHRLAVNQCAQEIALAMRLSNRLLWEMEMGIKRRRIGLSHASPNDLSSRGIEQCRSSVRVISIRTSQRGTRQDQRQDLRRPETDRFQLPKALLDLLLLMISLSSRIV